LSKKEQVRARIDELQGANAQAAITRAAIDRHWVLSGLREIAERAVSENGQGRAFELCGKVGMFVDRSAESPAWAAPNWTVTSRY
jgi:hypothetical protein